MTSENQSQEERIDSLLEGNVVGEGGSFGIPLTDMEDIPQEDILKAIEKKGYNIPYAQVETVCEGEGEEGRSVEEFRIDYLAPKSHERAR